MAYCGGCGANKGENLVCPRCGAGSVGQVPPPAPPQTWQQPGNYTQNVYVQNVGTNGFAVASLVCSLLICTWPLGIIFGHIGMSQIKKTGQGGNGLAVAGLVIGYILLALSVLGYVAGSAASGF